MTEIQLLKKKEPIINSSFITIKIVILWLFGAITALAFSWFLKDFITSNNANSLIISSVASILFLVVFLLQTLFVPEKLPSAFIVFLESAVIIAPFLGRSIVVLSLIPVIFLILFSGNSQGRNVLNNSLKIHFWSVSKAVLPKCIITIALILGAATHLYLTASKSEEFPISPFLFTEIATSGNFLFDKIFPGITSSSTIEEIAINSAATKLNQIPEARLLSEPAKKQFLQQAAADFYKTISSYVRYDINPKLTISDSLYQFAKEKFFSLSEQGKNMFFIAFGVIVFFTIEAVSWPLRIIISAITFIIFEILIALNFGEITFEERSKEIIIT